MKLFWLSFCDGQLPSGSQFLGACIIQSTDFVMAVMQSHILGLNPGGEVRTTELPNPEEYPESKEEWELHHKHMNKLMSLQDLRDAGFVPVNMDGERQ